MIKSRGRNVVVMSQFNIHGSRGKDAGKFISDYVSRDTATSPSTAYVPNPNKVPVQGDGVAFTLDSTAISRDETLKIAEHVQDLHATGKRAIQQMVISFDPDYLIQEHLVDENTPIIKNGDYRDVYDDVRLRHAVRNGLQSLVDREGYRDGKAIACIQWDKTHLHVHAVVYEDAAKLSRIRGHEEKGVIKESSFNQLTYDVNRHLELTKTHGQVPNEKSLIPNIMETHEDKKPLKDVPEPTYVNNFLRLIEERKRAQALRSQQDKNEALNHEHETQKLAHKIINEHGDIYSDQNGPKI